MNTGLLLLVMMLVAVQVMAEEGVSPTFPKLGKMCVTSAVCGELALVECGANPGEHTKYVMVEMGKVKATCGKSCAGKFKRKYCEKNCPPKDWTCTP